MLNVRSLSWLIGNISFPPPPFVQRKNETYAAAAISAELHATVNALSYAI